MDGNIAAVIITGLIATVGTYWGTRQSSRATDHARIIALESRVDTLERRYVIVVAYAQVLRNWIFQGKPPPPPDWPDLN